MAVLFIVDRLSRVLEGSKPEVTALSLSKAKTTYLITWKWKWFATISSHVFSPSFNLDTRKRESQRQVVRSPPMSTLGCTWARRGNLFSWYVFSAAFNLIVSGAAIELAIFFTKLMPLLFDKRLHPSATICNSRHDDFRYVTNAFEFRAFPLSVRARWPSPEFREICWFKRYGGKSTARSRIWGTWTWEEFALGRCVDTPTHLIPRVSFTWKEFNFRRNFDTASKNSSWVAFGDDLRKLFMAIYAIQLLQVIIEYNCFFLFQWNYAIRYLHSFHLRHCHPLYVPRKKKMKSDSTVAWSLFKKICLM